MTIKAARHFKEILQDIFNYLTNTQIHPFCHTACECVANDGKEVTAILVYAFIHHGRICKKHSMKAVRGYVLHMSRAVKID